MFHQFVPLPLPPPWFSGFARKSRNLLLVECSIFMDVALNVEEVIEMTTSDLCINLIRLSGPSDLPTHFAI